MAKLSALAISDAVAAFAAAGLADTRDFDALTETLLLIRNRIRASPTADDLMGQRLGIQRCVQPLVQWLDSEPDIVILDVQQKVDLLWNLYLATVSRTALADAFPLVCGNEETWNDAMTELFMAGPPMEPVSSQPGHFRLGLSTWMLGLGLLGFGVDHYMASGRWRFYIVVVSTLLVGLSFFLRYHGYYWWWYRSSMPMTSHAAIPLRPRPNVPPRVQTTPQVQPPPYAPPVPGNAAAELRSAGSMGVSSGVLAAGTRVLLNGAGNTAACVGLQGTIARTEHGCYDVELDSGLRKARVSFEGLTVVPPGSDLPTPAVPPSMTHTPGSGSVYAPYANDSNTELVKTQATRMRTALEKAYALQSTQPAWGALFWQAVKNEADLYGIQGPLQKILAAHGYVGPATVGPPRYEELKRQLAEVETLGTAPHGTGGALLQTAQNGSMASDPEHMVWHLRLPPDLQRAGPEIYRNIRAEGVASVRQWVNEQHAGLEARNTTQFQDLFTAATIIDFELASCRSETELMSRLAVSDTLEIQLRKLGSFIYFRRTKDKNGALRMLGVRAPGTNADIAPKWMLDDANLFSKAEYQRLERGQKLNKLDQGGSHGGGGKGGSKGKQGGGRSGGRGAGKPSKRRQCAVDSGWECFAFSRRIHRGPRGLAPPSTSFA
eukprot:Skav206619  [mRNA]  locus=scaffold1562:262408:264393:+ [translate_table: standard]